MLNYEPELRDLGAPESLIALERRDVFPLQAELRVLAWGGAMLIATGAGVLVSKNLDRIGPLALAIAITVAALGCYAAAVWRRASARVSPINEYLVLLGALLLSVDVAYIEVQFKLLENGWPRHFLILTVLHGIAAYVFDSKAVLSLALASLASWLGVEKRTLPWFEGTADIGFRALLASAAVATWRAIDWRFRASRTFELVFDHTCANLALFGALLLTFSERYRYLGFLLTLAAAAGVIWLGFRRGSEAFVIYGYAYAVVAIDFIVVDALNEEVLVTLYLIVSSIAAIVGLFMLHARMRSEE